MRGPPLVYEVWPQQSCIGGPYLGSAQCVQDWLWMDLCPILGCPVFQKRFAKVYIKNYAVVRPLSHLSRNRKLPFFATYPSLQSTPWVSTCPKLSVDICPTLSSIASDSQATYSQVTYSQVTYSQVTYSQAIYSQSCVIRASRVSTLPGRRSRTKAKGRKGRKAGVRQVNWRLTGS